MEDKSNFSCYLNKPHDISFAERPLPTIEEPHDVIVAINYTGVCGSDVHYWEHGAIGQYEMRGPLVIGHEASGTVVEVGSAVTSLVPGDRLALEPGYPCRRCEACLSGKYHLCRKMVFAASPPYHGTLTGFWKATEDFCYKLPAHVSLGEGALVEPLAVAVHMVRQSRLTPGQSVIVMGAGPVGLLTAAVSRAFGASSVVSVDIVPTKLDMAKEFAATHVFLAQSSPAAEHAADILRSSGLSDAGADVVIEASGAEKSIQTAIHAVRMGGTYVQGGMGQANISFPIIELCMKEVTAYGSFRYGSGDYKLAMHLVASGKVCVKKLISGVVEFRRAEDGIKMVKDGKVIKVLILGPNESIAAQQYPILNTEYDSVG